MLKRQERHNEGTLTALMSMKSLIQQDGWDNHTNEGKPVHAYNITQCRRHCLLAKLFYNLQQTFNSLLWTWTMEETKQQGQAIT